MLKCAVACAVAVTCLVVQAPAAWAASSLWSYGTVVCTWGINNGPAGTGTAYTWMDARTDSAHNTDCLTPLDRDPGQIRLQQVLARNGAFWRWTALLANGTRTSSFGLSFFTAQGGTANYTAISNHEVLVFGSFWVTGTLTGATNHLTY
jgi:hypothetical protein